MMRDESDEGEEDEVLRPPAYNEQRFNSRIEHDLGYEIPDSHWRNEIADLVYNPKPKAEFGFDPTIDKAHVATEDDPLVRKAHYAANTGIMGDMDASDRDAAPSAPTNLLAAEKGYVMPTNLTEETPDETEQLLDNKFGGGPAMDESVGHQLGQPLDTVDEISEYGGNRGPLKEKKNMRVVVKFRPLLDHDMVSKSKRKTREGDPDSFIGWDYSEDGSMDVIVQRGVRRTTEGKNQFHVDRVYDEDDDAEIIYADLGKPIIKGALEGKHATIFGFGATGGGKSYTIQGGKGINGIIQLAAKDLFKRIASDSSREYTVKASYIEIYNEEVRDLMADDDEENDPKSRRATAVISTLNKLNVDLPVLAIQSDSNGGVSVNASETNVSNLQNIVRVLHKGNRNRATEKTDSNQFSSRSHAIFRLTVESHVHMANADVEDMKNIRSFVATVNFVDLAGSENSARAGTLGLRKRETGKINQSLLSLSQVIHQLSLPNKPAHINYRDSKLTRLLQPHLAGNAQIAIICCASPSKLCVEETRATLKFGYNARRVKVKPKTNETVDDSVLIESLKKELFDTRAKYEELKQFVRDNPPGSGPSDSEFPMLDAFIAKMSQSAKTLDFVDAIDTLSAMSGAGMASRRASNEPSRVSSRRGSDNASVGSNLSPEADEEKEEGDEEKDEAAEDEDEDSVEAFRRQILAKFMEEAMGDEDEGNADLTENDAAYDETEHSTMNRTTNTEESMMTGFVTETDSDDSSRTRDSHEVFRDKPKKREVEADLPPRLAERTQVGSAEQEPKRAFVDDGEYKEPEDFDQDDLDLVEKFRSEILERFQDEIADEDSAHELDENALNVAVIANELITKFKKEIVYKYKNDFPEIQSKRVEKRISAQRVGENGIVGRMLDSDDPGLNPTDDSSGSGSSVEQFEDEFDDEIKKSERNLPQSRNTPNRSYSTQTDQAVVNGHGEGPGGKALARSETDPSDIPLQQSLGEGTSASIGSALSSDVADNDKGSSNSSPEPANPPGDDDDYEIPPTRIAVGNFEAASPEKKVQIKYLEEKLSATDELVETLFVELENAKAFIRELVFENAGGSGNVIDQSGAAIFGAVGTSGVAVVDEQILNQCEILKYGIYTSLLFFVFGQHELFLATVFFLWLSLEVATKT